jgi:hypothetical protein
VSKGDDEVPQFSLTKDEMPWHYHGVGLKAWVILVGWPLSLALGAAGVALAALSRALAAEGAGMVLAAAGGVGFVGLIRCRRFEAVVTARTLETAAGPFRRRVPLAFISAVSEEPAASWRRLYANREVRVQLQAGGRTVVVPTADEGELLDVLAGTDSR